MLPLVNADRLFVVPEESAGVAEYQHVAQIHCVLLLFIFLHDFLE